MDLEFQAWFVLFVWVAFVQTFVQTRGRVCTNVCTNVFANVFDTPKRFYKRLYKRVFTNVCGNFGTDTKYILIGRAESGNSTNQRHKQRLFDVSFGKEK